VRFVLWENFKYIKYVIKKIQIIFVSLQFKHVFYIFLVTD